MEHRILQWVTTEKSEVAYLYLKYASKIYYELFFIDKVSKKVYINKILKRFCK
jgi:hypothetical protein